MINVQSAKYLGITITDNMDRWIVATIKLLVKKRHKLYLCARKSKDPDVKIHYKRFRAHVQKVLRGAYS